MDSSWPELPSFGIEHSPHLRQTVTLRKDPDFSENFVRNARWCVDGSSVLAQCENRTFQVLDTPTLADQWTQSTQQFHRSFGQPGAVLDFQWYPTATVSNPAAYCFAASIRDCPVKLLDASDGRLRASYKIVDHRERQVAPHSLAFTPIGNKLYCGFEDAIEEFDVGVPGEGTRLFTTPSKKTKEGLKGIIGSMACQPSYNTLLAVGSFTPASPMAPNIALLTPEAQGQAFAFCSVPGVRAGVSQLAFNPVQSHVLYGAFRRHNNVYAWDLRGDTATPVQTMYTGDMQKTNQRLHFDIDCSGMKLMMGESSGYVSVFDLSCHKHGGDDANEDRDQEFSASVEPALRFEAHSDAVGCALFHPLQPLVLSASGSRHWPSPDVDSDDDCSSDSETSSPTRSFARASDPVVRDSSIKMWAMSSTARDDSNPEHPRV